MEKKVTCKYLMHNFKPCNRSKLRDDKYCIFHSDDIEGKQEEFNNKIKSEIKKIMLENIHDFTGFVFPDSISFLGYKFTKNTYFNKAKFIDKADFTLSKFKGIFSCFNKAEFKGKTFFSEVQFNASKTEFEGVKFIGEEIIFYGAEFNKFASFRKSQFTGEKIDFRKVKFMGNETIFLGTKFKVKNISFYLSFIENIVGLFDVIKNRGIMRLIKGRYKIKDFRFHLGENSTKEYPVIDRLTKDAWFLNDFRNQHPIIHALWNVFAKCGQSMWRWIFWSIIFALTFATKFYGVYSLHPEFFHFDPHIKSQSFLSFIYYSVVTFTTLGVGDIIPTIEKMQIWVMAEVVMGYIMLGGLISIFANKLARRS